MKYTIALMLCAVLFSCKKENSGTDVSDTDKSEAVENYAAIAAASYEDSYNAAIVLQEKINAFIANPTASALEACRSAWIAARFPYGQTEAYRFYGGPIDDEDGPEGQINAWPMDENWIDYVESNPNSGIINNSIDFPVINKDILINANEDGSETNIATGYHAIEFLLWGQDLSASTAGQRPYTDFVTDGSGTAANQDRRIQYLQTVTDLLVEDLSYLVGEWQTGGSYRNYFTKELNVDSALTFIIRGIGSLSKGELAGERMTVALTNQDQEDEHSCFSDNTHNDIRMNFSGVDNVYKGIYVRTNGTTVSGKSLSDVVGAADAVKNQAVLDQLADARLKVFAIPAPFDQQIIGDPGNLVTDAINSLRSVSDKIADAVFSIGISISF